MDIHIPVYIGVEAIDSLMQYCAAHQLNQFALVADDNTYPVLGRQVEAALKDRGWDVNTIVLRGQEIIADEQYCMQVLLRADRANRTYLAVGSGTITDVTRFVSHRTKSAFISIPTAPSVDGYTSPSASMVIGRLKQTVVAQPPIAIFADLATLCAAPRALIAAGFGDMLGKYTALADWKLGHLLWDEPYSEPVAQRVQRALQGCVDHAEAIGQSGEAGIRGLMDGLLDSGRCMLEFGNSRPAAGAEHYVSHYLEMKLLWENRPAILHGAKVGLATILVAKRYEQLRQLTQQQALDRLKLSTQPDRQSEIQYIRSVYGPIADQVVAEQSPFLDMPADAYDQLKQQIIEHWTDIQDIAARVPEAQVLSSLLREVGGAREPDALGLSDAEVALALDCSHYFRNRFTIFKLNRILGI